MKDRLCWEDKGTQHVLFDRKTGFTMGRLELRLGWWTFTHLGRVMGSRMDKEEAENLGFTLIRAIVEHNEALRLKDQAGGGFLDEAMGRGGSPKHRRFPKG